MNTFQLRIASPDGDHYRGAVSKLTLRGTEGDLAVMAGHVPFVTAVVPCKVKVEAAQGNTYANIGGGLLSVSADETVLLSSDYEEVPDTE